MDARHQPQFPLTLTQEELASFNQFWRTLPAGDREILDSLMQTIMQQAARQFANHYFPFHALLLSVLIEERKEIRRLQRELDDMQK